MKEGVVGKIVLSFPVKSRDLEQISSIEEANKRGLIGAGDKPVIIEGDCVSMYQGGTVNVPEKLIPKDAEAYVAGSPIYLDDANQRAHIPMVFYKKLVSAQQQQNQQPQQDTTQPASSFRRRRW